MRNAPRRPSRSACWCSGISDTESVLAALRAWCPVLHRVPLERLRTPHDDVFTMRATLERSATTWWVWCAGPAGACRLRPARPSISASGGPTRDRDGRCGSGSRGLVTGVPQRRNGGSVSDRQGNARAWKTRFYLSSGDHVTARTAGEISRR